MEAWIMKTIQLLFMLLCIGVVHSSVARDLIENAQGMKFVRIPAGEFIMGTQNLDEALGEIEKPKAGDLQDEAPAHKVVINRPFYIGQTEVTQQQWLAVMENKPGDPDLWNKADWKKLPVAAVSWFMAKAFVRELSKMDSKYKYRLPSEAEWEYVAKAGSPRLRPITLAELEDHAWFIDNSGDMPHPVATRQANAFGVYDMLGNVWEWVEDWYGASTYTSDARIDPEGPKKGRSRVRRGGSYHCPLYMVRPGYRSANEPGTNYDVFGLRVIAELR